MEQLLQFQMYTIDGYAQRCEGPDSAPENVASLHCTMHENGVIQC